MVPFFGKRQFLVWLAMGATVLVYAVWSGRAASATGIFFLCFPTLSSRHGKFGISRRWQWLSWPLMVLLFGVTMTDLAFSRAGDPWFSSPLHRAITGVLGVAMLLQGCAMRRTAGRAESRNALTTGMPLSPS